MARWIICQTKEAKRSKIAGTAGEIVGNFVRIYYVHNVLAQGFEVVGGGDIFTSGSPTVVCTPTILTQALWWFYSVS